MSIINLFFFLLLLLFLLFNPTDTMNVSNVCLQFGSLNIIMRNVCFKATNGSGPADLSELAELLHVYNPSRTLCSSSDTRLLKIQQYKRKTRGFRSFSCFGPHVWNSLPQDLRHCSTLSSFKVQLKNFLFS